MARVQVDIPESFAFKTDLVIRVSDLNYGGHVGNDSILSIMQEARVLYYRSLGFNSELSFEGTIGQIITDAVIQYKAESFFGDVLSINIAVANFNKYGFDMIYVLTNQHTGKEVARGKTGIVCFDYAKRKIASVPNALLQQLQKSPLL
ncbi:MAG TPA: thioesterase family protein [Ohtaekwangia sp.]|nr:thioesterase family protein [Ohtaekwangia sp.]